MGKGGFRGGENNPKKKNTFKVTGYENGLNGGSGTAPSGHSEWQ